MWHVSIGLVDAKNRVIDVDRVSESNRRVLIRAAKELLQGVGQVPTIVEQVNLAIHYRKSLSDAEVGRLPLTWCEIPAIDDGGGGIVLERDT